MPLNVTPPHASLVTVVSSNNDETVHVGVYWVVGWVRNAPGVGPLDKQFAYIYLDAANGSLVLNSDAPCGLGSSAPC